jgi:hypothetical protein
VKNREKLVFYFDADDDGTGELFAEASANGFSGVGSAWFNRSELLEFANALATYPIPKDKLPKIAGGFWRKDVSDELDQEHLAISVYPIDGVGNLGVQVRLATAENSSEMRPESLHVVKLEIQTKYNALATFSKQIIDLVNGRIEKAVLENA